MLTDKNAQNTTFLQIETKLHQFIKFVLIVLPKKDITTIFNFDGSWFIWLQMNLSVINQLKSFEIIFKWNPVFITGNPVFITGNPVFNTGHPAFLAGHPAFLAGNLLFMMGSSVIKTGFPCFTLHCIVKGFLWLEPELEESKLRLWNILK